MSEERYERLGAADEAVAGDAGADHGSDELAVRLSEVARDLQQQDDPNDTLANVVKAAISVIPGVDEGSISVVLRHREVNSHAPSSELPRVVDALQHQTGQGPCLDAAFEHATVHVADMRTEGRWPKFAARAYEAGAGSMLSFQLYVEGDNLGALNLYSRRPHAFDDESVHVGLLFAAHAAVAYAGAVKQSGLVRAVETRQRIGQAQGILMERERITDDQAFERLVQTSQHTNTKLRDVADRLVETGEITSPAQPRRSDGPDG